MRFLLFSLFLTLYLSVNSQKHNYSPCGSEPTPESIQLIQQAIEEGKRNYQNANRSVTSVPCRIWWMTDSTDVTSVTEQMINMLLNEASLTFESAFLSFYQCDEMELPLNTEFQEFTLYEESSLKSQFYTPGLINVYIVESLNSFSGDPLCGYAKFPGSSDMIFMDEDCLLDGSTFNHELGHFFGLYHTHGLSNNFQTNEFANGVNCSVAGDDVCDTPADPNLKANVDNDCSYTGNVLDQNGDPFQPDPSNMMCYAPAQCRVQFSDGQLERMSYIFNSLRSYLQCAHIPTHFALNYNSDMCSESVIVDGQYNGDASQLLITWDVNQDEVIDYSGPSFSHTFTQPGDYDISMYVQNDSHELSAHKQKAVQIFEQFTLPVTYHFNRPERHQYQIDNPDFDQTWYEVMLHPQSNDFCINIDNYHNYQRGEIDAFTLPPIELNGETFASLWFDVAYAYHGINYEDQLEVLISQDCGLTYETVYQKAGEILASIPELTAPEWMPTTDTDWRTDQIDLTPYLGQTILIQFRNTNDFGNHLYIDNIIVDGDEILAYEAFSIKGKRIHSGQNRIQWEISSLENLSSVWLEGGQDENEFHKLKQIDLAAEMKGDFDHRFLDGMSFYYRLAGIDVHGQVQYSNIIYLPASGKEMIRLYPNPVHSNASISLSVEPTLPVDYAFAILDFRGVKLIEQTGQILDSFQEIPLSLDNIPGGVYFLQFELDGRSYLKRFIKL